MREALFSIWQLDLAGSRFLDAYSGAGAVGLEAASRGAAHITFLDHDANAIRLVTEACQDLAFHRYEALRVDLPSGLSTKRMVGLARYELVFADPPYDYTEYRLLVVALADKLAPSGLLGVEHSLGTLVERRIGELECYDRRSYGGSSISFFRHAEGGNRIRRKQD